MAQSTASRLGSILGAHGSPDFVVRSKAKGPEGQLPLTADMLLNAPSGDVFGLSMDAGMGWDPTELLRPAVLLLSTQGGIRSADGTPIALGYHTGHWEVGLQMQAAAVELKRLEAIPFAAFVTDPCDGRTQGTDGMLDSLPYRNDAAIVLRRLIRSLPTRKAVIGVATCDKGLPAMLLALAGTSNLPTVLVPGGVTLPPEEGEDAGKVQTIGARFAQGELSLQAASELGCKACATSGGGCQFLGTAATAQVVAEALGMALPHSALAPSGQEIWLEMAKASARAALGLMAHKKTTRDILTDDAIHNAMVTHAAIGGSTNLLLHIPAIAFQGGLKRPTVDDWERVNRQVPRIVDALPNGPVGHPTVRVFMAGGVPEVMLHLRDLGLLRLQAETTSGERVGDVLEWWEHSDRRKALQEQLLRADGIHARDVIMSPSVARDRGLTSTVCFPRGNLAPNGSVIKSTSIDPRVVDSNGVYRRQLRARVFTRERDAVTAIKTRGVDRVQPGDVIVLICGGPLGTGMEETYQVTSALKHLSWGKDVAVITDSRFSGVSTGACVGHVSPEALAGGPIGKIVNGDLIEIVVDRNTLHGTVNLIGHGEHIHDTDWGTAQLGLRPTRNDLAAHPRLPDDTRLWALLQNLSGGVWGGCVYDVDAISASLQPMPA